MQNVGQLVVGEIIRDAREACNLTQTELASLIGVSITSIRQWEKNIRHPRIGRFAQLKKAIGVDIPPWYKQITKLDKNGESSFKKALREKYNNDKIDAYIIATQRKQNKAVL